MFYIYLLVILAIGELMIALTGVVSGKCNHQMWLIIIFCRLVQIVLGVIVYYSEGSFALWFPFGVIYTLYGLYRFAREFSGYYYLS